MRPLIGSELLGNAGRIGRMCECNNERMRRTVPSWVTCTGRTEQVEYGDWAVGLNTNRMGDVGMRR